MIFWGKTHFSHFHVLYVLHWFIFSLLTYFGAQWLIDWQFVRDPRAYYSIIALAPAVFFVTILASSRGYLQGWQRMTPTAVSQIVEQIFRVVTMILFAQLLLPYGLEYASAGASLGALAGAITGVMVLVYFHIKLEKDIVKNYGNELKPVMMLKQLLSGRLLNVSLYWHFQFLLLVSCFRLYLILIY